MQESKYPLRLLNQLIQNSSTISPTDELGHDVAPDVSSFQQMSSENRPTNASVPHAKVLLIDRNANNFPQQLGSN